MKNRKPGQKIFINCFNCEGLGYISGSPIVENEPPVEGLAQTPCPDCQGTGKLEAISK